MSDRTSMAPFDDDGKRTLRIDQWNINGHEVVFLTERQLKNALNLIKMGVSE